MTYYNNNIFAKILRGELPCDKVYEDEFVLAFHDIHPQAPCHVLVLPKGEYISQTDFSRNASSKLIEGFSRALGLIVEALDLEEDGYRIVSNIGDNGGQIVPHLHYHILGGKKLGPMLEI